MIRISFRISLPKFRSIPIVFLWWPVPAARALALSTTLVRSATVLYSALSTGCRWLTQQRMQSWSSWKTGNGRSSDPKRWENVAWPRNLPRRLPFFPAHQSKGILPGEITPSTTQTCSYLLQSFLHPTNLNQPKTLQVTQTLVAKEATTVWFRKVSQL